MAVAIAAPATPISSTKMKTGSRAIFSAAPASMVPMVVLAAPSLVTMLFMVTLKTLNTEETI